VRDLLFDAKLASTEHQTVAVPAKNVSHGSRKLCLRTC